MHRQQRNSAGLASSLFVVSVCLLAWGFYSNRWHVANQGWFDWHQRDSESLVIGRLVKSRQDGLVSCGGLIGLARPSDTYAPEWPSRLVDPCDWDWDWPSTERFDDQYRAYINALPCDKYSPYMSQVGGHGMLFGVLDRLIPLPPQARLRSFHLITSILTALALTLVIRWFYREFGLCVALFV